MRLLILFLLVSSASACSISHHQLWKCMIEKGSTYDDTCVTAVDIHRAISKNANIFTKSMVFVAEGSSYSGLVGDCDVGKDGCIHLEEAVGNNACERSCLWRRLFSHLLGC